MAPRLPAELTDYTVDFLHDDQASLRSLALVAHATLPAARYHLFHTAPIQSNSDLDKFTSLVSANPHITSYVHTLSLSKKSGPTPQRSPCQSPRVSTIDTASAWETVLPTTLPALLPSLRAVHLHHFLSFWQPASFSLVSLSAFSTVQSLRIADSSLRSFTELRLLLTSLPDLRHLVLEGVGIAVGPDDLHWLLHDGDKDTHEQIVDGTTTPPDMRARAHSVSPFQDTLALSSLHVAYRSSENELFSPILSVRGLTILLNYLLATPTLLSMRPQDVKFEGFDGMEDCTAIIKPFKEALVKATRERVDVY